MNKKTVAELLVCGILTTLLSSPSLGDDDFSVYDRDIPQSYSGVNVIVEPQFSLDPYPVKAETIHELGRALLQAAPDSSGGLQSISRLTLNVDWKINSQQTHNYCELYGVKIESHAVFTQPQWIPGDNVSEEDMDKWDSFLAAITDYQDLNKRTLSKQLEKFAAAVKKIKPEKLCSDLDISIDNLGTKYLKIALQELNALAQETAGGTLIRNMEFPDFYSGTDVSVNSEGKEKQVKATSDQKKK